MSTLADKHSPFAKLLNIIQYANVLTRRHEVKWIIYLG